MSGLRAVARNHDIECFSSLSHALARHSSLRFICRLIDHLNQQFSPRRASLVAIDTMTVSVPASQRHRCPSLNNQTAGCGVLWAFDLDCLPGQCPVGVLAMADKGPWCDSHLLDTAALQPDGPVYLMDGGFRSYNLFHEWIEKGINFIVRLPYTHVRYEVIEVLSQPCANIEFDGIVKLGSKQRRGKRPIVRLVIVKRSKGNLALVTGLRHWRARRIAKAYRRRWEIESFHRVLKEAVGLSHLYSFHVNGMLFLTLCSVLLATLVFMQEKAPPPHSTLPLIMRQLINSCRKELGIGELWKRNTVSRKWQKRRRQKSENL